MLGGEEWIWPPAGVEDYHGAGKGEFDHKKGGRGCPWGGEGWRLAARRDGSGLWARIFIETSFKIWKCCMHNFLNYVFEKVWHVLRNGEKCGENTAVKHGALHYMATPDASTKIWRVPSSGRNQNIFLIIYLFVWKVWKLFLHKQEHIFYILVNFVNSFLCEESQL